MAGRKTKYTPEKAQELIKLLSGGATVKDSCAYIGISEETLSNWGKRDLDFLASVNKARSMGKIECAALIRQAARSNWQAAAWFLERSDPERWGRRDKLTILGEVPVDLINRLIKAMEKAGVESASSVFEDMLNEFADAANRAEGGDTSA